MTNKRTVQLRTILESLHGRLLLEIADTVRGARPDEPPTSESSSPDYGRQLEEDDAANHLRMKTTMLRRIDDALGRLDAGDFGFCADCGIEIAEEQLKVAPFAARCRDCQEAVDRRGASLVRLAPRT